MPDFVRPSPEWRIFLNGEQVNWLQPTRIESTIGSQYVNFAELMVDPNHYKLDLREKLQPLSYIGWYVDILCEGAPTFAQNKHSGVISHVAPRWHEQGETLHFVSRTVDYLFGEPLAGYWVCWPLADDSGGPTQPFQLIPGPVVFNPEIDGRTVGNRDSRNHSTSPESKFFRVFIDPESVRTEAAENNYGAKAREWRLSDAVLYLCQSLNRREQFAKNPTIEELRREIDDDRDLVRNIEIPHGVYLPAALDSLLGPLGYCWYLERRSRTNRRIRVQRRDGGGKVVSLKHQKYGETFDPKKTNTEALSVNYDGDRLANRIIGRGSREQIEVTVELVKAWPANLDNSRLRDLKRSRHAESIIESPDIVNAYRKWVLNETGAYIGTRTEIDGIYSRQVRYHTAAAELTKLVPRPRLLRPTLTLDPSASYKAPIGRFSGVEVEYLGPPLPLEEGEVETAALRELRWQPAGNWGIEILENEGGIYIAGEDVPVELLLRREEAAIRVTATLELDTRLTAYAEPRQQSPQPHVVTADLDLDGQFHRRRRTKLSKYLRPEFDSFPTLSVSDRIALQEYVDLLRDRWDSIDVGGPVVLEGVDHHEYDVGMRVEGVVGKRLPFDNRAYRPAVPTIAGVTLDILEQKTTLHLTRFQGANPTP